MMSANNGDPRSPTAVIDMRLLRLEDEGKLLENMDQLPLPSASANADLATESSLPPLHSLSCCARSANNDDSSSVSSVSLDGDTWDTPQVEKRYIFATYWQKKGGRPKATVPPRPSSQDPKDHLKTSDSPLSRAAGDYEHLLEQNESAGVRRTSDGSATSVRRRSLFGENNYVSQSVPSQLARYAVEPAIRKIQSTSGVRPRQSCLRKPRYSGGSADTLSRRSSEVTSTTTVSFSDDIHVKYLKPSAENWAPRGWSNYFV